MSNRIAFVLGTWFGCGYAPVAPGTAGAAAALLLAWAAVGGLGWGRSTLVTAAILVTVTGTWAAGVIEERSGVEDPGIVVIDEVAGLWVTLLGATAYNWLSLIGAFILFRIFDIWKPPPVRKAEKLGGGFGIMADDILAGLYGAVVLYVAGSWNLY